MVIYPLSGGLVPPHQCVQDHPQARVYAERHDQGLGEVYSIWCHQLGVIVHSWVPAPARNDLILVNSGLH